MSLNRIQIAAQLLASSATVITNTQDDQLIKQALARADTLILLHLRTRDLAAEAYQSALESCHDYDETEGEYISVSSDGTVRNH